MARPPSVSSSGVAPGSGRAIFNTEIFSCTSKLTAESFESNSYGSNVLGGSVKLRHSVESSVVCSTACDRGDERLLIYALDQSDSRVQSENASHTLSPCASWPAVATSKVLTKLLICFSVPSLYKVEGFIRSVHVR